MLSLSFCHALIIKIISSSFLLIGYDYKLLSHQKPPELPVSLIFQAQSSDLSAHKHSTPLKLAHNTQLSQNQINQLKSLEFKNKKGTKVKPAVVLPFYIPAGFKLIYFEIDNSWQVFYQRANFFLIYRNQSNNSCFSFDGFVIPGAGGASGFETIRNIQSPIGKINIGYTSFDRSDKRSFISSKFSYLISTLIKFSLLWLQI